VEARIQYAKTSDGVDIAFTTYGDGPAIVIPPNILNSHLQLELTNPSVTGFLERLSTRLRVVRYDPRGLGMSQREPVDFSAEAMERDLLAVVDRAGVDKFALYNHVIAGEGPMACAVHHPERVVGVVFWVGQTLAASAEILRHVEAAEPVMDTDWELYTQIIGRLIWGWDSPQASPHAEMSRAASSPHTYRESMRAAARARGTAWPGQLKVPTLVMHLAGADEPTNAARKWAAANPLAHILAVPGHSSAPRSAFLPFL
jgi:pimeloyl-ACP methyl ester carboxylesterase